MNKICDISGLVTTALNTKLGEVENKIQSVSGLVKKTLRTSEIEGKYFITSYYKRFISGIPDAKVKQR